MGSGGRSGKRRKKAGRGKTVGADPAPAAPPQLHPRSSSRSALRSLAPGGGSGSRPQRSSRESIPPSALYLEALADAKFGSPG